MTLEELKRLRREITQGEWSNVPESGLPAGRVYSKTQHIVVLDAEQRNGYLEMARASVRGELDSVGELTLNSMRADVLADARAAAAVPDLLDELIEMHTARARLAEMEAKLGDDEALGVLFAGMPYDDHGLGPDYGKAAFDMLREYLRGEK